MANLRLFIKGAYYLSADGTEILRPHFTGEFSAVDCTRYMLKSDILEQYDGSFWDEYAKDDFIVYEGENYHYSEYSPYHSENIGCLLSDLSELEYIEQDFNF